MRGGVLRSKVDYELVGSQGCFAHRLLQLGDAGIHRRLTHWRPLLRVEAGWIVHVLVKGVLVLRPVNIPFRPAAFEGFAFLFKKSLLPILAQRVAGKTFPHQDALQVGMAGETDAKQVIGFSFLEICPWIDRHQRR